MAAAAITNVERRKGPERLQAIPPAMLEAGGIAENIRSIGFILTQIGLTVRHLGRPVREILRVLAKQGARHGSILGCASGRQRA